MKCIQCKEETKNPKFCSRSCAAKYNNKMFPKRVAKNKYIECLFCKKQINIKEKYHNKNLTYCSCQCSSNHKKENNIIKWKLGEKIGTYAIRNYLIETRKEKCEQCNWAEINKTTKRVPLDMHHIDGDYKNNKEENLKLLCPNCHALTSTYKSLNKNGTREYRKKYRKDREY